LTTFIDHRLPSGARDSVPDGCHRKYQ
jgi:hypothetical protein